MNKTRLKELAKNPKLIPGVYNWCDRWCEKCTVSARCLNRGIENEDFPNSASRDVNNEKFWKRIAETFKTAMELLEETAAEQGIDLKAVDLGVRDSENKKIEIAIENNHCIKTSGDYIKIADEWFKNAKGLIEDKGNELERRENAGHRKNDPFLEAGRIKDAINVIYWYKHQIFVKLKRALSGELEEDSIMLENSRDDSDGSAKVALIGISRSIGAWEIMRQYFPDKSDDIFDILLHLGRLRKKLESEFPKASSFKRPGFEK